MSRHRFIAAGLPLAFAALAPAAAPPTIDLPDSTLHDKIRGALLGEMLGDLNGLPHEMKYLDSPGQVDHYTPSLPAGAWTDDDTDIEWVHHLYMEKLQTPFIPYDQIAAAWTTHINRRIWSANEYARRLFALGILPPYTGRIAINPFADFNISGEFDAESFGLCAPAMPQLASRIGLHYTHITIDGEPAQQTQFFDTLISLTFIEPDLNKLLDAGTAALDPKSELREVIADARRWHAQYPDWHDARRAIHDKYTTHHNELPDKNGYQLNTAAVVASLLYGQRDFAETLRLTFNFGWDADCTAATAGTIIGALLGGQYIDDQIAHHGWVFKDLYRNTCRDQMPMDETATQYCDRVYRIAKRTLLQNGATQRTVAGQTIFTIPTQPPANIEPLPEPLDRLPELTADLLPQIEKDLAGSNQDRARAAYLAICLNQAPRLAAARPADWTAAVAQLKTHAGLINRLFKAPPSTASAFQARFTAAGLAPSTGELLAPQ